jgi:large subunit ribosomal protein L25
MAQETLSMDLEIRTVEGKRVKNLRKAGLLPAVMYGKDFEPLSVQVDARAFGNVYRQAGRTSLVTMNLPGKPGQAGLIYQIQRHPVTHDIIHADLWMVNLREKIHSSVPVVLTGESPLMKSGDAVPNQVLSSVEIYALPADIPHQIEVDLEQIDSFDKSIYVRDLSHEGKFEFVTPEENLVVTLTQTRMVQVDEAEEEEEPAGAEPELIRKEREDEE